MKKENWANTASTHTSLFSEFQNIHTTKALKNVKNTQQNAKFTHKLNLRNERQNKCSHSLTSLSRLAAASIKIAVQLSSRSGVLLSATAAEIDNKHSTDRTQYIPLNIVDVVVVAVLWATPVRSVDGLCVCVRLLVCIGVVPKILLILVRMCGFVVRVNAFATQPFAYGQRNALVLLLCARSELGKFPYRLKKSTSKRSRWAWILYARAVQVDRILRFNWLKWCEIHLI